VAEEQLSFIIADLTRFTSQETLALALDIQANLQEDTPRDTGWARANWVPSVATPHIDTRVEELKGRRSAAEVASASAIQAEAASSLLGYDIKQGPIFTTNNVPYIIPLNEGHSPQAGAGFVQRSVARALQQRETVSR
jgi:hypothetical protein